MLSTARNPKFDQAQDELACLSFLDKFFNSGNDTSLKLNVCALHEALYSLYLKENKEKILALYFHNHETDFSLEFCNILANNDEAKNLLDSHFIIHGLDVGEDMYQNDLIEKFASLFQLTPCVDMVRKKQPAVFFIAAVDMDFQICTVLRDIPSLHNITTTMSLLVDSMFQENMLQTNEATDKSMDTDDDRGYGEFQQKMFEWMGNRDYDRFEANELDSLKEKISFALFGMPVEESGYSEKQKEETQKMYDIILETSNEFSEYENQVTMAILYNCLIPVDSSSDQQFSPVPIFILRKCTSAENPCRIIIDHTRRVYKSWSSYLEDNKFCECLMVVPEDGRYIEDENGRIKLQKLASPACQIGHKILKVTDITTSVLGIGSTGVMVAAAVPAITIAPFALLGAAAVGAGVGVYSIGRSISTLVDRGLHKESLKVTEAESRAAYLNIAAGVVGFAGAGANVAVSQLAANGVTVGTSARIAVNTLGVANIGISGLAVSNSAVEIFMQWWVNDETPSALSILQLSTSILFFGHAVYNFKTAGAIIEETQTNTMKDFKDSLGSNKQRKMFRKLELETIRQNGGNVQAGRAEVISAISRLRDKSEVFSFLSKNNKIFNEKGVKFSAKGGQITFNGVVVDLKEISSMSWKDSCTYFSNLPKSSTEHVPTEGGHFTVNLQAMMTIDSAIAFLKIIVGPISLREKLYLILSEVFYYLNVRQAEFKLIEILQEIFPNGRHFIAMTKMVLAFIQKKAELIQSEGDSDHSDNLDRILLKYFKDLDDCQKKLVLIQHVCDALLLAFQNNRSNLEDLLRFCIDWVMNAYIEHVERTDRNETVQQGVKKEKVVKCTECEGQYFEA
ncbi:uncharacterized protein LOC123316106 [Coccinella septempunctata]|uniref:uncharacterized protein LOC123316106 n=1 Tax=Coccinella septempunctata TaxID=41139 RepID=UPI001D06D360|nr:uncharacterized protein LOC123316106 [Coccinella septempunctata]